MSYRRLVDGIILNTIGNLAVNFLGILIGIIQARYLGPSVLGTFFLISNIPFFLSNFLSLGFNQGLNRFVAEIKGAGKVELLLPLLQRVFLIRTMLAFVAILVFFSCSAWISQALKIQDFMTPPLVYLVSVWIFLANINSILVLLLNIEFEQKKINILNISKSSITLLLMIVLVVIEQLTIQNLLLVSVSMSLVHFLACCTWMKGRFQRLPLTRSDLRDLLGRFVRYSLVLYTVEIMGIVLAQHADIYFIGYFLTPAAVSFYLLASTFSIQLYQLVRSVPTSAVLLSTMVDGYKKGGLDQLNRYLKHLLLFTTLYTVPIMMIGTILAKDLIFVIYGKRFLEAASLLVIFLIVHLFTTFGNTLAEVLKVLGKQNYLLGTKLITTLNIPLFILLLPRFGLKGAILTTATTHLLVFLVETLLVTSMMKLDIPWRKILRILVAGVLMGSTVYLTGYLPLKVLHLKLSIRILAGCTVYAAVILRSDIFEQEALKYFPRYLRRFFSQKAPAD